MTAIQFRGESYRIADTPGIWPLMQFARAARSGLTVLDMDALAAIYNLLESCIAPEDWTRFENDAITSRIAGVDELLDLATSLVATITDQARTAQAAAAANGQARE